MLRPCRVRPGARRAGRVLTCRCNRCGAAGSAPREATPTRMLGRNCPTPKYNFYAENILVNHLAQSTPECGVLSSPPTNG